MFKKKKSQIEDYVPNEVVEQNDVYQDYRDENTNINNPIDDASSDTPMDSAPLDSEANNMAEDTSSDDAPIDDTPIDSGIDNIPIDGGIASENSINEENSFDNAIDNNYVEEQSFGGFQEKKSLPIKKLLIIFGVVLLIVVIVLAIVLLTEKDKEKEVVNNYENEYYDAIVNAGKDYYDKNKSLVPTAIGDCTSVSLDTLLKSGSLTSNEVIDSCDMTSSIVKACKLNSGNVHFAANLSCSDDRLKINYSQWQSGDENSAGFTPDSDVKFEFLAQKLVTTGATGEEKEYWEDEIDLEANSYVVTGRKTYYRYRSIQYRWYLEEKNYYPNNSTNSLTVSTYYKEAPNKDYTLKGSEVKNAAKWYVYTHDVYDGYSSVAPKGYPVKGESGEDIVSVSFDKPKEESYRTIKANQDVYRVRSYKVVDELMKVKYQCYNPATGHYIDNVDKPCNEDEDAIKAGLTTIKAYKCYYKNATEAPSWQSGPCEEKIYTYGNWSEYTPKKCEISKDGPSVCQTAKAYVYTDKVWKWYSSTRKEYYPSKQSDPNKENTYYVNSPVANAIRDDSTVTTAYQFYKLVQTDLGYSATSPKKDAKKSSDVKYSAWSSYSLTKPSASNNRQVQERVKVFVKQAESGAISGYENITENYVSLEKLIQELNKAGYKVSSLDDLKDLKTLTYTVRMSYRTPKK